MNKYNISAIFLSSFLFSGCATNSYVLNEDSLSFNSTKTSQNLAILKVDNNSIKYNSSSCASNTYTIKQNFNQYGELNIENIELKTNCVWNGLSRGFYEGFFKEKAKIDSMKLIKRFDIENYEFSQYKINDKYLLNLVFIWNATESTFIIDTKGKFSSTLLEKLSSTKNLDIGDKIYDLNFNSSLAKENWFRGYFGIEDKEYSEILLF